MRRHPGCGGALIRTKLDKNLEVVFKGAASIFTCKRCGWIKIIWRKIKKEARSGKHTNRRSRG